MQSLAFGAVRRVASATARTSLRPLLGSMRTFAVPTTADRTVYVTFVNRNGERLRVPGMQGQTVYEVAVDNKVEIGDMMTCHVMLSPESYKSYALPLKEEVEVLQEFEDISPTSRMASFLELNNQVKETYVALTSYRDTYIP